MYGKTDNEIPTSSNSEGLVGELGKEKIEEK